MNQLMLEQENDWIIVKSSNPAFAKAMRSGVIPPAYRKYELDQHRWLVWWEKAPELVDIASRFYQVDWSRLPGSWQMLIAGGRKSSTISRAPVHKSSPFSVLHLLDSAPLAVVKAAYKALVFEYHPDHNDGKGDSAKLNEVIEAYREVISTFDT